MLNWHEYMGRWHKCFIIRAYTLAALMSYEQESQAYRNLIMPDSLLYICEHVSQLYRQYGYSHYAVKALGNALSTLFLRQEFDKAKTYMQLYESESGLFDHGTLAAHCVHLDESEIDIIKRHNIRVAHNPGSNLKLASGICPVTKLMREGITVALGTDGASSNNNLDMLEEIKLAALIHKVDRMDPLAVTAAEAIQMGTENGARAIGLKDAGRIEKGMKADLVMLDMNSPAWTPCFNPASLLVYSGNSSAVDTVIVDGKILMENHELKTLDEEKVLAEAANCARRLTGK